MKITLRGYTENDALPLYKMCLDEDISKSGIHSFSSVDESLEIIQSRIDDSGFKVIADENDRLIGFISLCDMNRYEGYMELEYAVTQECRNKGIATRAILRMCAIGFEEMGVQVIAAWVRSHNEASVRVLEKCGFTYEGRLRQHARDKSDTLCYSILREEWENREI